MGIDARRTTARQSAQHSKAAAQRVLGGMTSMRARADFTRQYASQQASAVGTIQAAVTGDVTRRVIASFNAHVEAVHYLELRRLRESWERWQAVSAQRYHQIMLVVQGLQGVHTPALQKAWARWQEARAEHRRHCTLLKKVGTHLEALMLDIGCFGFQVWHKRARPQFAIRAVRTRRWPSLSASPF